jgi:hypothetical protein
MSEPFFCGVAALAINEVYLSINKCVMKCFFKLCFALFLLNTWSLCNAQEVQIVSGMENYSILRNCIDDNDTLYFSTYGGIFKFDGIKVDTIAPLSARSGFQYTIYQNKIYFSDTGKTDFVNPSGLYKVSKAGGQITKINEFGANQNIVKLFQANNKLFIVTTNQIHEFDGDAIKQIFESDELSFSMNDELMEYNNNLIFNIHSELYGYDGNQVRLMYSGGDLLRDYAILNGMFFFKTALSFQGNVAIYKYDGNVTRKVFDMVELYYIYDFLEYKNKLYFMGDTDPSNKSQLSLFEFDGVNKPQKISSELIDSSESSFNIATIFNRKIILRSTHEIAEFDGVNAPKKLAKELSMYVPTRFFDYGDRLVFTVNSSRTSQDTIDQLAEPWYIDKGGVAHLIKDIRPGVNGSWPGNFFLFRGVLNFEAENADGMQLWRYRPCKKTRKDVYTESCEPIASPSGDDVYSVSGLYADSLFDSYGCDSVIYTHLSITDIDNTIGFFGNSLISNENYGSNYRWLDCDNNYAELANGPSNRYQVSKAGNYAVEITKYGCTQLSDCKEVNFVGINENSPSSLSVYPNPSQGKMFVSGNFLNEIETIKVTDLSGKDIPFEITKENGIFAIDFLDIESGVYFMSCISKDNEQVKTVKVFIDNQQ